MKKKNLFLRYLRSRLSEAAVLLLFSGVFALVFLLCGLPLDAVGYALMICAALGFVFLAADYLRFRERSVLLDRLLLQAEDAANALPSPRDEIEAQYQALLRALHDARLAEDLARRKQYDERAAYHTLWVHQVKGPIAAMRLILQDKVENPEGFQVALRPPRMNQGFSRGALDSADAWALRGELRRVEQYVEMVLCYIRLDSDSTDYLIRRCPLDEIIRAELRAASSLFIRAHISLEYEDTNYTALTDAKWLGFVIGQILSNSLKYTPQGGRISIYMEGDVLCIRDSGVGIPPEDLPRVMESGFTGRNGRDERSSSGLGLYLCRRVLQQLGHGFEIRSERGAGVEARIDLAATGLEVE